MTGLWRSCHEFVPLPGRTEFVLETVFPLAPTQRSWRTHLGCIKMMWCIPLNIQSASRTRKFKSKFASGASNRQKHNFYDFGVRISFWCNLHTSRRVNEQTYCIHSDWTIVVLLLQIPPMLSHDSQGTGRWCRGWVDLLATRRSRSQKAAFLTAKNGGTIPTTLRLLEEMSNMPSYRKWTCTPTKISLTLSSF